MENTIFFICWFLLDPTFSLVEINYEIHDKEFLGIMDAFEEWRHLFEGVQHETIAYLDHKNL
jgi:hypothetical protein